MLARTLIAPDKTKTKPYLLTTPQGSYLIQNTAKENPAAIYNACNTLIELHRKREIPVNAKILVPSDDISTEAERKNLQNGVNNILSGTGMEQFLLPAPPVEAAAA